jgi:hypothetical protein
MIVCGDTKGGGAWSRTAGRNQPVIFVRLDEDGALGPVAAE